MAVKSSSDETLRPYHHGDVRQTVLTAAALILARDGISALTLRAAAREAGVSHAAPKNHFGDLKGLLSEVAAAGFHRLHRTMLSAASKSGSPEDRLHGIGGCYVSFAQNNPGLFRLMFRSERLDLNRPALAEAASGLLDVLATASGQTAKSGEVLDESQAMRMTLAWAQVHGLATLLLDGELRPILQRLPPDVSERTFLRHLIEGRTDP